MRAGEGGGECRAMNCRERGRWEVIVRETPRAARKKNQVVSGWRSLCTGGALKQNSQTELSSRALKVVEVFQDREDGETVRGGKFASTNLNPGGKNPPRIFNGGEIILCLRKRIWGVLGDLKDSVVMKVAVPRKRSTARQKGGWRAGDHGRLDLYHPPVKVQRKGSFGVNIKGRRGEAKE